MKTLMKLTMVAAIALSLIGCDSKPKLYVYTWADYIDPELIHKFEEDNNCRVMIDSFDSNESLLAKLMSGGGGYDIIMPTDYILPALVEADIVDKIDVSKIPLVVKNLDRSFATDNSLTYTVPYAFSCIGIMWRKDKTPKDLQFKDWNEMFDKRLSGYICMMNDIREVIGLGLKMRGHSVNSTNKAEIAEAVEVAKAWKGKCTKMDNEAYRTGIPSGEFHVAMAYNSDAVMLMVDDPETIGYSLPTNGIISSMDVFCVMKKSKSKDLAYKFIDMFYDPKNAAQNAQYNCAPMPVLGMYEELDDEYKKVPFMRVTDEMKANCESIRDVGSALDLYSKAWDKVKSSR